MNPFRGPRQRRLATVVVALTAFVLGSNYCLLSAWGGNTRMACLSAPATTSAPACSHCGPGAKAPRAPERTASRSCCPAPVVVPVQVSLDANTTIATLIPAPLAVLAEDPAPPVAGTWFGHPPLHDGQPPTPLVRARLAARAPPLV